MKGEWPIVSKVADALLQNQLTANSPLSGGYPGLGDVDMASLPPGFAISEDGQPEDPSKAFKLKRVSVYLNQKPPWTITVLQLNSMGVTS